MLTASQFGKICRAALVLNGAGPNQICWITPIVWPSDTMAEGFRGLKLLPFLESKRTAQNVAKT